MKSIFNIDASAAAYDGSNSDKSLASYHMRIGSAILVPTETTVVLIPGV
jgi:hypothetical protein